MLGWDLDLLDETDYLAVGRKLERLLLPLHVGTVL